jgi:hypothetical protein
MTGTKKWMETLRLKTEVRGLRRSALAQAREIIAASPEAANMQPEDIDLAARNLFDIQFKALQS